MGILNNFKERIKGFSYSKITKKVAKDYFLKAFFEMKERILKQEYNKEDIALIEYFRNLYIKFRDKDLVKLRNSPIERKEHEEAWSNLIESMNSIMDYWNNDSELVVEYIDYNIKFWEGMVKKYDGKSN